VKQCPADRLHARTEQFGADFEAIEQACRRVRGPSCICVSFPGCRPASRVGSEPQNQRSARFGVGFLLENDEDRWRILDSTPETEPGVERNVTHGFRGNIAQIKGDQTETSALYKQIRGTKGLVDIPASHPEQLLQFDASSFCRIGIEGIAPIYKSTCLPMSCSRG
jgi:hypothetical protein